MTYDFTYFQTSFNFSYSPEFTGRSGTALYPKIGMTIPLPHNFEFNAAIGRQYIDNNINFGTKDYNDWSLSISYALEGYKITGEYADSNIDENVCIDNCGARGILSVSKSFE